MQTFSQIFCIDGSGNRAQKSADLKRPIYQVETAERKVSRIQLNGQSAFSYFKMQCNTVSHTNRILIAADVVIGLPAQPEPPWGGSNTFPEWLEATQARIGQSEWREELIANGLEEKSADRPFVKVKKGLKKLIAYKRLCDTVTSGESVYCIDSGPKQVGRASLQFWFEVLMPLKREFQDLVAIWPFESFKDKPIVVAECYPTASQANLELPRNIKRNAPKVVDAILSLKSRRENYIDVSESTWLHAVSSEDEFDTFTTAFEFANRGEIEDLMWHPVGDEFEFIERREGWMLGLRDITKSRRKAAKAAISRKAKSTTQKVGQGQRNRNDQENRGRSGNNGPKGPMVSMICRRVIDGVECANAYETNPQDVFHKKCPRCQDGK